jgi:hypothetical protein
MARVPYIINLFLGVLQSIQMCTEMCFDVQEAICLKDPKV